MGAPEKPLTYWQSLAVAADQGDLFLDAEAAAECSSACSDYIARLVLHQTKAKSLADIRGWGDFDSGRTIRKIYAEKAVGGENNMVDVLEGHIEVVRQMQAVFQKFFVDTGATDDGNATDLGQQGPK